MIYRKNTQHKLEFSHPGDADFVPYENRPMCPYGASCYRLNNKHKVEFRHPAGNSNNHNLEQNESTSYTCRSPGEKPPCIYGSNCYRRNSTHRKQFYHPPEGYICCFHRSCNSHTTDFNTFYEDLLNPDIFNANSFICQYY